MKRFDSSKVKKPKIKVKVDEELISLFSYQQNWDLVREDVFTFDNPYMEQFYEKEALKMASDYFN